MISNLNKNQKTQLTIVKHNLYIDCIRKQNKKANARKQKKQTEKTMMYQPERIPTTKKKQLKYMKTTSRGGGV